MLGNPAIEEGVLGFFRQKKFVGWNGLTATLNKTVKNQSGRHGNVITLGHPIHGYRETIIDMRSPRIVKTFAFIAQNHRERLIDGQSAELVGALRWVGRSDLIPTLFQATNIGFVVAETREIKPGVGPASYGRSCFGKLLIEIDEVTVLHAIGFRRAHAGPDVVRIVNVLKAKPDIGRTLQDDLHHARASGFR